MGIPVDSLNRAVNSLRERSVSRGSYMFHPLSDYPEHFLCGLLASSPEGHKVRIQLCRRDDGGTSHFFVPLEIIIVNQDADHIAFSLRRKYSFFPEKSLPSLHI